MRPKGLPPDQQPVQRVLDWLVKYAPSACNSKAIGRALRMKTDVVTFVLVHLERDKFLVLEESQCYRAAGEDDPIC